MNAATKKFVALMKKLKKQGKHRAFIDLFNGEQIVNARKNAAALLERMGGNAR